MSVRWTRMLVLAAAGLVFQQAFAFQLLGARWPTPETTVFADIPGAGGKWNSAFDNAAAQWTEDTVFSLQVVRAASNPCAGYSAFPDDLRNGTGFEPTACGPAWGASTLAVTLVRFQAGTMLEADTAFNSGINWDVYSGPWQAAVADFRRVAVHEQGHVIGLNHENTIPAIMQAVITVGDTKETPLPDDIAGVDTLYGAAAGPVPNPAIVLHLEEPVAGVVSSGVSNVRGWAIAPSGVDHVELFIDGVLFSNVPSGSLRPDVGNAFPDLPNSFFSGFSMAFNFNNLTAGPHEMSVRAVDNVGGFNTDSASFSVAHMDNPFIVDPSAVSLLSASALLDGNSIVLNNVQGDGKAYNIVLQWSAASQGFEIVSVVPAQ
jgi:matrixin